MIFWVVLHIQIIQYLALPPTSWARRDPSDTLGGGSQKVLWKKLPVLGTPSPTQNPFFANFPCSRWLENSGRARVARKVANFPSFRSTLHMPQSSASHSLVSECDHAAISNCQKIELDQLCHATKSNIFLYVGACFRISKSREMTTARHFWWWDTPARQPQNDHTHELI